MSFIAKCLVATPLCAARAGGAGLAVRLMPTGASGEFTASRAAPSMGSRARCVGRPAGKEPFVKAIRKALIAVPLCATLWSFPGLALADDMEDAMEAYDSGCYALAVEHFQAAARAGNARAQEVVAFMYAQGDAMYPGVTRNPRAGAYWFDLAGRNNGRPVGSYMAWLMQREALGAMPRGQNSLDRTAEASKPKTQ
jgi:TPR repeat protein